MFDTTVWNEYILNDLRRANREAYPSLEFDTLILDETQDMTDNLYWVVTKYLDYTNRRLGKSMRLIVLGDARQAIYEFRGADPRFCTLGHKIFSDYSPDPWDHATLDQSFRLTHQNAQFVNAVIGEEYVRGSHEGPKPKYIHTNSFDPGVTLGRILPLIWRYSPEECAIIAPFVFRNKALSTLTNRLSGKWKVPVAEPRQDGPLDPKVLRGKLAVGTYHQMKGSERRFVVVYGADQSYLDYFARDYPDDRCPNPVFVALTRARNEMMFVHDSRHSAMPFVVWKAIENEEVCEIIPKGQKLPPLIKRIKKPSKNLHLPLSLDVSRIPRHVDETKISNLMDKYLKLEPHSSSGEELHAKTKQIVKTDYKKNLYEAVSDLNGIAVLNSFEWKATSNLSFISPPVKELQEDLDLIIPNDSKKRARWFAKEAAYYSSELSLYQSRLNQMKTHPFDWLDELLEKTDARLTDQFEATSSLYFKEKVFGEVILENSGGAENAPKTLIKGRVDIVEDDINAPNPVSLWAVKFAEEFSPEHIMQLVIQGYLWTSMRIQEGAHETQFPRLILFNAANGAKLKIFTDYQKSGKLLKCLLKAKYERKVETSDEEFLRKCEKIRETLATDVH
jgi:hypothetical protein